MPDEKRLTAMSQKAETRIATALLEVTEEMKCNVRADPEEEKNRIDFLCEEAIDNKKFALAIAYLRWLAQKYPEREAFQAFCNQHEKALLLAWISSKR